MKLKIFVLEDNAERNKVFRQTFAHCDLVMVKEADQALSIILHDTFDVMFLDHDLGDEIYVPSTEWNTGYTVARRIMNNQKQRSLIVIHSWNMTGALNMEDALAGYPGQIIRAPFASPEFQRVVEEILFQRWTDGVHEKMLKHAKKFHLVSPGV